MPADAELPVIVDELRAELASVRRSNERLQSALYDLELRAPAPGTGQDPAYRALVRRVREVARTALPHQTTVAVISRGDPALLDLYGRTAWHFPQAADGRYAGYYPRRALSAIAHLEALRARGAQHLLIPATALWWLDHYPELRRHLERRHRLAVDERETCLVFDLEQRPASHERPLAELEALADEHRGFSGEELTVLDWGSGLALETALPEDVVFRAPATDAPALPYLDATVDVVVTAAGEREAQEARRVAALGIALVSSPASGGNGRPRPRVTVERKAAPASPRLPSVSIVIPCHDGAAVTRGCLRTLLETLPDGVDVEVLVVDDASTDDTPRVLEQARRSDDRVRVLRARRNRGFVGSCNAAAEQAHGELLLFLNNDTVLLPGWLPPLLGTFRAFPDAGAVGGRLLYPDGRLQEAGCLVFADGSAWKYGYGDPDPQSPVFRHVRPVDYVSGALLMTPRALFAELGGFDTRYGFGFYEDDDYCFAVRAAGRGVLYQPDSVVVHVEGASAGTDLAVGTKRFQVANQRLFADKWADALHRRPRRPDRFDAATYLQLAAAAE